MMANRRLKTITNVHLFILVFICVGFASGEDLKHRYPTCKDPVGMASGEIDDSLITASSFLDSAQSPARARLGFQGAWTARASDSNAWIQVSFPIPITITAVATQGHSNSSQWVKKYILEYSPDDKGHFVKYENGLELTGNSDQKTTQTNVLGLPLKATRLIRIVPKSWEANISLRFELYGCKQAFVGFEKTFLSVSENAGKIPVCVLMQGLVTDTVNVKLTSDSNAIKSPSNVTFAANKIQTCFDLIIQENNEVEHDKTAHLILSVDHPLLLVNETQKRLKVLIRNDDKAFVGFEKTFLSVSKNAGRIPVCVLMQRLVTDTVNVKLTSDSNAIKSPSNVTFAANKIQTCFDLIIQDNNKEEHDKTAHLILSVDNPLLLVNETQKRLKVLIRNDDKAFVGFEKTFLSVSENAGKIPVCVLMQRLVTDTVNVKLTSDSNAIKSPSNVTFAANKIQTCFDLIIQDNNKVEHDKTAHLILSVDHPLLLVNETQKRLKVLIRNDDKALVGFEKTFLSVSENAGKIPVCVLMQRLVTDTVNVKLTSDSNAIKSPSNVTFAANKIQTCFDLIIQDNNKVEHDKTAHLILSVDHPLLLVNETQKRLKVLIRNDDKAFVGFEKTFLSVSKNAGKIPVCVLMQRLVTDTVNVKLTSDSNAIKSPSNVTFAANKIQTCFDLIIQDNNKEEHDKTAHLILSVDHPLLLVNETQKRLKVLIRNDDKALVGFEKTFLSVSENAGKIPVCVLMQRLVTDTVNVKLTSDSNAIKSPSNVTFAANKIQTCFDLIIQDNNKVEHDKTAHLILSVDHPLLLVNETQKRLKVLIRNDDKALVGFEKTFLSVSENAGKIPVCVLMQRLVTDTVNVKLTSDSNAIKSPSNVTFAANKIQTCFDLIIQDNNKVEHDKTAHLILSVDHPLLLVNETQKRLKVLIRNDDKALVGFEKTFLSVSENAGKIPVCVLMQRLVTDTVNVKLTSDSNIIKSPSNVTFAANKIQTCFDLIIQDNNKVEHDKTAHLILSVDHPLLLVNETQKRLKVLIRNDDKALVGFEKTFLSVSENAGKIPVCVLMQRLVTDTVNVKLTSDSNAIKSPPNVTFAANKIQTCFDLIIQDNNEVEHDKTAHLILSVDHPLLLVNETQKRLKVLIRNDDKAFVGFEKTFLSVSEDAGKIPVCVLMQRLVTDTVNVKLTSDSNAIKSPSNVTFAANKIQTCFDLIIQDNNKVEHDKIAHLILSVDHPLLLVNETQKRLKVLIRNDDKALVGFEKTFLSVSENAGKIPVCVLMQRLVTDTVNVKLTSDSNAIKSPPNVTFAANKIQTCFDLIIQDNIKVEHDKTAHLILSVDHPLYLVNETQKRLKVLIRNDDQALVGFEKTFLSVSENAGKIPVCVLMQRLVTDTVNVKLTSDSNAIKSPPNVTFAANKIQTCFDLIIQDNIKVEHDKTAHLILSVDHPLLLVNETQKRLKVLIRNDDKAFVGFEKTFLSVSENAGKTPVCVLMHGLVRESVNLEFTSDSNAMQSPSSVKFAANETKTCFDLNIQDNNKVEHDKTSHLILSVDHPLLLVNEIQKRLKVLILNDDIALVGFEKTFLSVSENAGKIPVCVLMQGLVTDTVNVKLTSDSNAIKSPPNVTFAANKIQTCFDLIIQDNNKVEHDKTAHLILSVDNPLLLVNETQKRLKVLIRNDDKALVGFEKTFLSVSENAGKIPVCVLMQGLVTDTVNVKLTSDSNAIKSPPNVTFAANKIQTCFDLIIQDNNKVEHDKTAHLILSVDHPLLLVNETQKRLKVLIRNDDKALVGFEKTFLSVSENAGKTPVCVLMQGLVRESVNLEFTSGSNAMQSPSSVKFAANETKTCFDLNIQDNNKLDYNKIAYLFLSVDHPLLLVNETQKRLLVLIRNDDKAFVGFEKTFLSVSENAGKTPVCVLMQRLVTETVNVKFTSDSNAMQSPSSVKFAANETKTCFDLNIQDNNKVEHDKTAHLILSVDHPLLSVNETQKRLKVLILNDDKVFVGFEKSFISVSEDAGKIPVCVLMQRLVGESVNLELTSDSNAMQSPSSVKFAANETKTCFDLNIQDNIKVEYDKTAHLILSVNHPLLLVNETQKRLKVLILNDDKVFVGFEKPFLSVSEDAGKTPVCVLMQGLVKDTVNVKFTSDSNATKSPSNVTFAANQTQTCFDLIIQDNIKVEHNKTAHLILSVDHPLLSVKETQKQLKVLILNDNKGKANLARQKPGQLNDEDTETLLLTVIAIAGSFFGIALTVGIILLLIRLQDKKKKRNDENEES